MGRHEYRGPTRAEKKRDAGDGATRADKKAGKKNFGGSDGAGEKKKKNIPAGAKKNRTVESQSNKKDSGGSGGIPPG